MPKNPHRKGSPVSTKVYNAFKVKDPAQLWGLIDTIFHRGRANVEEALRAHYVHEVRHMDPLDKAYAEAWALSDSPEANFRLQRVRDMVRDRYKENVTKIEWDTYSLDVRVCFYPYKDQVYVRTFCESGSIFRDVLNFVKHLPELEDFHYQNQTDRPEEITPEDWDNRRRVWDGISKKNHDIGIHVDLEISSWHSFYLVDPWVSLAREWMANPPVLPSREEVWAENWKRNTRTLLHIEAGDGYVTANKGRVVVLRNDNGTWTSNINGKLKRHKDLNRAASHVEFEHQSEIMKDMIRGLIARSKAERAARRGKRAPK